MPYDNANADLPPHNIDTPQSSRDETSFGIRAAFRAASSEFTSVVKRAGRKAILSAMMAAGAALGVVQAADASTVTATMTGTVTSGTDTTGIFGSPGANLAGKSFTLTYTFDDSKGTQESSGGVNGLDESRLTSTSVQNATAVLQIGSGSWNFGGYPVSSINSEAQRYIPPASSTLNFSLVDYYTTPGSGSDSVVMTVTPATGSPPLTMNYNWEGSFTRTSQVVGGSNAFVINRTAGGVNSAASGNLTVTSISVDGPASANDAAAKALGDPNCLCETDPDSLKSDTSKADAVNNQSTVSTGSNSPVPQVADPITVSTGNMYEQITDYSTAGANPLTFVRYYNSQGNGTGIITYAQSVGTNWRTNYDRYLQLGGTTIVAERPDGRALNFTQSGSTWVSDSDVDVTLTQAGSTYTLTSHNDTVETYNTASMTFDTLLISYGQLETIASRNGYTQTLSYSGSQLQSVTDSYSRSLNFTYSGALVDTVTTPDTLVLTYAQTPVTGGAQLTSVSYNTTPTSSRTYLYENSSYPFALTGITDENGNRFATWTYDAFGNAKTSQHGTGTSTDGLTTMTYNSNGTTTVTNAFGVADTYTFRTAQNMLKVSQISRASTSTTAAASRTFAYDTNGFLNSVTDWNGNSTTFVNNSHGDPTTINEAVGSSVARTTTISYDPTWVHLPHQIVTPGLTSTLAYDGSGNPLTRTDLDTTTNSIPYSTNGQSRVTTWTWSSTGQETSVQLPRTDVTAKTIFGYTGGTLTSITDPLSHVTNITSYTGGGLPLTVVDQNSVTTTLTYDGRLNLNTSTLHTGAGNLVTTWTHDPANELTAVQLPDNSKLTYGYNNAHRLTTITDLLGNSVNYTLDALGDRTLTQVENPSSTVTQSHSATFDALGRTLHDIGGMSQTTVYTWDKNGNTLTVTPPSPSGVITLTYDALNRLATSKDPSPGGTTTLTYDAHDRMLTAKDANNNTTTNVFDGFGDRTQTASPDSGTTVMYYNADRGMTQITKPGPLTANLTYDANDRNLTVSYPSDTTLNVARTYDQTGAYGFGIGRLTSWTDQTGSGGVGYDERGNVTAEARVVTGVGTLSTSTAFDAANNISSITYPSGTIAAYGRDTMGRVTSVTAQPPGAGSPSNVATSVTYEPFGPVTGLSFGNGITGTYGFDLDYRPTTRVDAATATVQNLTYGYFANNSVHTITDAVNTLNSQTLGYDALDRLTSASSGTGGYGTLSWTWDPVSNVKTQVVNGTTTTYTLNTGTSQLQKWVSGSTTENVASTAAGNINTLKIGTTTEETLAYNQANELASATTTSSYAAYKYDLTGQRLEKAVSGSYPVLYQYGQAARELLAENDLHSGQTADYIYLNGRPIGEVNPTNGKIYFMHTDRLGTPDTVTDSTKAVVWNAFYHPFGDNGVGGVTGTLTTQNLRLPGQTFDPETGMNHNGFRDYAGNLTRYVESDPIGLGGGTNTYQYVKGNPFKWTDRRGLSNDGGQTVPIGGSAPGTNPPLSSTLSPPTNGPNPFTYWLIQHGFGKPHQVSLSDVTAVLNDPATAQVAQVLGYATGIEPPNTADLAIQAANQFDPGTGDVATLMLQAADDYTSKRADREEALGRFCYARPLVIK
jgi:RHS repeat-associated protein